MPAQTTERMVARGLELDRDAVPLDGYSDIDLEAPGAAGQLARITEPWNT